MIRRSAWSSVGGFDERQWMYAEDLDICWRLRRSGWTTWYEPAAVVRHAAEAATAQAWGEERTEQWMWSSYAWLLRRRGAARTRTIALLNLLGDTARAALLAPLARLSPPRFAGRHQVMRRWARLHRIGLKPRSALESHR